MEIIFLIIGGGLIGYSMSSDWLSRLIGVLGIICIMSGCFIWKERNNAKI